MSTSALTPTWSRIIHRLSTLGVVEAGYSNSIATFTEIGTYPRHITTASETSSQSIDRSTHWNFLNWQQGWIQRRRVHHAVESELLFSSYKNSVFHRLRLIETSPNDCLNCLLQLFASSEEIQPALPHSPVRERGPHWRQIGHLLERSIEASKKTAKLDLTLYTEGGLIHKTVHSTELFEQDGSFTLSDQKSNSLRVHTGAITHLQTKHLGSNLQTTLFNANSTPLAVLKHCA